MSDKIYTEINSEYLKKNPTWHVEDSPWKAMQILKILKKNKIDPKSIVEVGCGAGEILNQLYNSMPNYCNFKGYDISADAINIANQRLKDRLEFKLADFLESEEHFDLLLVMDVFEHIDNYLGFLKACKNKAEYTIFHIPLDLTVMAILRNNLIRGRKLLGHLHYFMKETAIASLVDSGFEIVDSFYTAGPLDLPKKTIHSKFTFLPRKLLFTINEDLAVKLFGGFSLLVLAK